MTGVLFDLDGTLLDTLEDLADGVNYALQAFGYPTRTLPEIRRFVGNGAANLIARSVPEGADPAPVLAVFQPYYRAHSQIKTKPYPGIPEAVSLVRERCPVAVVSNKPDPAVKGLCREFFGDVFALGEIPQCPRKPAPDMLLRAMEALGIDRCIYVGDSEVDVVTAKNAGMPCLSVTWGFRDVPELMDAGAKHFCHDPKMLAEAIFRLAEQEE